MKKEPIQEFDDGSFVTAYKLDDDIVCFVDYMLGEMVSMEIMLSVSKSYLDDPESVNMFRKFITSLVEKGSEIEGLNRKLCELEENFEKLLIVQKLQAKVDIFDVFYRSKIILHFLFFILGKLSY